MAKSRKTLTVQAGWLILKPARVEESTGGQELFSSRVENSTKGVVLGVGPKPLPEDLAAAGLTAHVWPKEGDTVYFEAKNRKEHKVGRKTGFFIHVAEVVAIETKE